MAWEALVLRFLFMGIDYWAAAIEHSPDRAAMANPFIAMARKMLEEQRGPNAEEHAALDKLHAELDARIDAVIARDDAAT